MSLPFLVRRAPSVLLFQGGGCNGCALETVSLFRSARFDPHQFRFSQTWNPRETDVVLVTGVLTGRTEAIFLKLLDQIPDAKVVVACGACASVGGQYRHLKSSRETSNVKTAEDLVEDVHKIPGCPPTPDEIIYGLLQAMK